MANVFSTRLEWTGAGHAAVDDPALFSRDLSVAIEGHELAMSSAPEFQGDPARINPEQLYVAAISACQALTYLSLAARKRIGIVSYSDHADGWLEKVDGRLRMSRVRLHPRIVLAREADEPLARELVERAHGQCFIGNSVSAAVIIDPVFEREQRTAA